MPSRSRGRLAMKDVDMGGPYIVDRVLTGGLLAGPHNSFLVKRKTYGGVQFSRDPLNLVNQHSRKVRGLFSGCFLLATPS